MTGETKRVSARRRRTRCKHFDETALCCKNWRKSYVCRGGKIKAVSLSRECTMRGDCGYEEKIDAGGDK